MTPHFSRWTTKLLPLLVLVISFLNAPTVAAVIPPTVVRPQYASLNGILYIQGGAPDSVHPVSSFYSLTLTKSWNDTAPLWKTLPTNSSGVLAPTIWVQTMSATADKESVLIWDFSNPYVSPLFNIKSKSWTNLNLPPITWTTIHGLWPLISPDSPGLGTFYVPNGCQNTASQVWYMCKLDLTTNNITSDLPMSTETAGVLWYSFVYCSLRKSLMLYGGYSTILSAPYANARLSEYNMVTNSWSVFSTLGTSPGDINSHCMVETSDKSKMIVFGGISIGNLVSSRLYILHLGNSTWVQGPDAGIENARYGHVCSTYGDSFVVWGGQSSVIMGNTPLIYNIPINQWVHDFVVSGPLPENITTTTVSTSSPTSTSTSTTTTTIVIPTPISTPSSEVDSLPPPVSKLTTTEIIGSAAGAVGGGVAVIAAFGFFLYRRRKRAARNTLPASLPWNDEFMGFKKRRDFGRQGVRDDYEDESDSEHVIRSQSLARKVDGDFTPYPSSPYMESSSSSTLVYDQLTPSYQQQQLSNDSASETTTVSGATPRFVTLSGPVRTSRSHLSTFSVVSSPSTISNSVFSAVPSSSLSSPISIHNRGKSMTKLSPTKLSQQVELNDSYMDGLRMSSAYHGVIPDVVSYYQSPQYIPLGYMGRGTWGERNQDETRSPQQLGARHETSPAAWMSVMVAASPTSDAPYTRRSRGLELPQSMQSPEPVRVGDGLYLKHQPRREAR